MESTAPVASDTAANATAKMKINARKIILLSPAPLQKISSLWLKLSFLFINKEKILAMRMATMTGILNSPVKMAVPIYNKINTINGNNAKALPGLLVFFNGISHYVCINKKILHFKEK